MNGKQGKNNDGRKLLGLLEPAWAEEITGGAVATFPRQADKLPDVLWKSVQQTFLDVLLELGVSRRHDLEQAANDCHRNPALQAGRQRQLADQYLAAIHERTSADGGYSPRYARACGRFNRCGAYVALGTLLHAAGCNARGAQFMGAYGGVIVRYPTGECEFFDPVRGTRTILQTKPFSLAGGFLHELNDEHQERLDLHYRVLVESDLREAVLYDMVGSLLPNLLERLPERLRPNILMAWAVLLSSIICPAFYRLTVTYNCEMEHRRLDRLKELAAAYAALLDQVPAEESLHLRFLELLILRPEPVLAALAGDQPPPSDLTPRLTQHFSALTLALRRQGQGFWRRLPPELVQRLARKN